MPGFLEHFRVVVAPKAKEGKVPKAVNRTGVPPLTLPLTILLCTLGVTYPTLFDGSEGLGCGAMG